MSSTTSDTSLDALLVAANELGVSLGVELAARRGPAPGANDCSKRRQRSWMRTAFEPGREGNACLVLGNCPFSPLAREYVDLVCRANLALMQGLASGLRIKGVEAVLALQPGRCCVAFQPVPRGVPARDVPVQR